MPPLNVVIDLSHHNQNLDFQRIRTEGGIAGVIHKATQGIVSADPTYQPHKAAATGAGLLGSLSFWDRERRRAASPTLPRHCSAR
jgi:glycosyl hydrolase family 25